MWSLAHTLEHLRPSLPPSLVSESAFARLAAVARRLPAALTQRFYLERWLSGAGERVDLIVRVDARGRALLAEGACAGLTSFAREWDSAGGALDRGVEALWLEFDLPEEAAEAPAPPRVFVDFTREAHEDPSVDARMDLLRGALRPLLPGGLAPSAVDGVRACLERLPPGATIPYVGLAPAGDEPVLRVCAQGLGGELVRYLHALGWPGDGDDLGAAGDPLAGVTVLHVDVASGIAPRIGLEYAFARASQARGLVQEAGLLDALFARTGCDAPLREGLLRWPGSSVELLPHEIWLSRVTRRLNHVKLTYATGQPIGLKAYLCCQHELAAGGTLAGTRPYLPTPHPSAIE